MAFAAYTPTMTGIEEAGLIRKILAGRQDLFGDLIAPHLAPLLHIVQATTGGHPDVDDIVQQTAIKAFTHLEQFRCVAVHVGENQSRVVPFRRIDHAHKNRDTDTVNQFGVSEIDHQNAASHLELSAAFSLDLFAAQLVEIIAGVNDGRVSNAARSHRNIVGRVHIR